MAIFTGAGVAIITPFHEDGSINYNKLGTEFGRYKERWDKLSRTIQTVNNDVENIHKTTEKMLHNL